MNQINLDINKSGQIINEPVVLRVGEKDQTITVNLLKDGRPYTSFTTATFFANKPSGSIIANDPANISNGVITYTVPQALVNEFGKITNAYFLIDGKGSTESFVIAVLKGVNVSDDLNDYIPGMSNLNVIYDKWKAKLDGITREMAGIDAPKEVQNVVNNVLKDYANQLNDLKGKLNTLQADVNNLKIPEIGGRNYALKSYDYSGSSWATNANFGTITDEIYNGTKIVETNKSWQGPKYYVSDLKERGLLDDVNQKWTLSEYVKVLDKGTTSKIGFFGVDNGYKDVATASDTWHQISFTFTFANDVQDIIRFEQYGNTTPTTVLFAGFTLTRGSISTDSTPAPEDKVSVVDTDNWQKQKIFQDGSWALAVCNSGTDFGEFLKSDQVPIGFSIIRDNNSQMNWKILKESNNTIYGMSQDLSGNIYHSEVLNGEYKGYKSIYATMTGKTITATDDTGKTVKLKITGIS